MIVTYPLVNDRGEPNGGVVSLRFMDIYALETMTRWQRRPPNQTPTFDADGDMIEDHYVTVPGCVTIYAGRTEFNIQADLETLKAMMLDLNEWGQ